MKSKKLIALTAIVALAFLPLNANAAPTVSDYENVYVIQNSEGEVKKVIAVDWLHRRRFSSVMPLLLKARWG